MKKLVLLPVIVASLLINAACSSGPSCGAGTVLVSGQCVAVDAGPGDTCGAGTVLVDGQCVAIDAGPGTTCGAGTLLVNGQCVEIDAGPGITCGDGTVLVSGQCVAVDAGPGIVCGAGTVLLGDACVALDAGPGSTVVINAVGLGTGTVTGAGVTCGAGGVCTASVAGNATLELTAAADPGYFFAGWRGGGCSGTGTCSVTPSGYTFIEAGFSAITYWGNATLLDGGAGPQGIYATTLGGGTGAQLLGPGDPALAPAYVYASSADGMTFAFSPAFGASNAWQGNSGGVAWVADFWAQESRGIYGYASLPGDGTVPAGSLSPDGTRLALEDNGYLVVLNSDGSNAVSIGNEGNSHRPFSFVANDCYNAGCATGRFIAWSPDSNQVAWIAQTSSNPSYPNVWIGPVDGGKSEQLTNFSSATINGNPNLNGLDWSPDGTKIAFVSSEMPADGEAADAGAADGGAVDGGAILASVGVTNLWTVNVETLALNCVTNFDTEYWLDMATYSRTGNTLVFSSTQNIDLNPDAGTGARNLFAIEDDGTGLRPLTYSASNNAYNEGPYWAPDGVTLVFESNQNPVDGGVSGQGIWTVGIGEGATPAPAGPSNGLDYSPLDDND